MKVLSTSNEAQRTAFVDSLYNSLRKKTEAAINKHHKMAVQASSYLNDGLDNQECIELLMIEGKLSREAATSYVSMAQEETIVSDDQHDYSFQFEDDKGKILSSYDIGKRIFASNDSEAWEKSEAALSEIDNNDGFVLISVNKVD